MERDSNSLRDSINEITNLQKEISTLRTELNTQQQRDRSHNIEIVGVPEISNENLSQLVLKIANHAGLALTVDDFDHVNRVKPLQTIKDRPKTIVVKLKKREHEDKRRGLGSCDLDIPGAQRRIFVNEHLTTFNKILYKKTREIITAKLYQYCWIKNCSIYVIKDDKSKHILIRTETDLKKII